jgi:hypothetical protein
MQEMLVVDIDYLGNPAVEETLQGFHNELGVHIGEILLTLCIMDRLIRDQVKASGTTTMKFNCKLHWSVIFKNWVLVISLPYAVLVHEVLLHNVCKNFHTNTTTIA